MLRTTFLLLANAVYIILSAQNVGINTTTPQAPLHVVNPDVAGGQIVRLQGNSPSIGFYDLAGNYIGYLQNNGNTSMELGTPGSRIFHPITPLPVNIAPGNHVVASFLPNGNAGIGITSPDASAMLHINTGSNSTKGFLVSGTFSNAATVPNLGAGSRLMFYPGKAAFRAGSVDGTQWDNANVGGFSVALGLSDIASGYASTAIGQSNVASGNSCVAMGAYARSIGWGTIAIGQFSMASSYGSVAIGSDCFATGRSAVAMGEATHASGDASTAFGSLTHASGPNSTAMGEGTVSKGYGSTVIGRYNDSILTVDDTQIPNYNTSLTSPLFIIGNGFSDLARSNALVVRYDGNVGIGTNSPSQKLQVVGNICATGTIGSCSDIRYKTNLLPLTNALTAILNIHPIFYNWKKEFKDKGFTEARQIGFSAQEVEKYFPEMVQTDADGYKAVDYSRMTAVLVEAVKEQQAQIDGLKSSNASLAKELAELRDAIGELKKVATVHKSKAIE